MSTNGKVVRVKNGSGPASNRTLEDYREERAQKMLKVSWAEANKKLERGELTGTPAESELKSLRFLSK